MLALLKVAALTAFTRIGCSVRFSSGADTLRADNFQTLQSIVCDQSQRPTNTTTKHLVEYIARTGGAAARENQARSGAGPAGHQARQGYIDGFWPRRHYRAGAEVLTLNSPPYGRSYSQTVCPALVTRDLAQHIFHQRIRVRHRRIVRRDCHLVVPPQRAFRRQRFDRKHIERRA